ncbi:MAG: mitochondrial fission ELM1 family protein [Rhizobiaceae bacterium]
MSKTQLNILILTDGKIGDLVQCRGVASTLTDSDAITEVVVEPGWLTALPLPFMPLSPVDRQLPWMNTNADMVIASGRRTLPYLRELKKRRGVRCFMAFLKDPTLHHSTLDVIWAPEHDQLNKPNAFNTATSPHAITPAKLSDARRTAKSRYANFTSPNVGLILGGNTKSVSWGQATRDNLATALQTLPTDTNVLVTASRRTPTELLDSVTGALADYNSVLWTGEDGQGENPYLQMLSWCDRLIVTGDSHNMVSESLTGGRPVHVFRPDDLHPKMHRFLDGLEKTGLVQDVREGFDRQSGEKVDATPQICAEIMARYDARQ